MSDEIKSGEGSAEEQIGEAVEQPREGTEVPVGEEATLPSAPEAAAPAEASSGSPTRFRHANEGTIVVDGAQERHFIWAGDPAEVDGVVAELNEDPEAEGRFLWQPGVPRPSVAPAAETPAEA